MIELTEKQKIERLILYKCNKTYTFIKDNTEYFYNGFVVKVNEKDKSILFKDDYLGELPFSIKGLLSIQPSRRVLEVDK